MSGRIIAHQRIKFAGYESNLLKRCQAELLRINESILTATRVQCLFLVNLNAHGSAPIGDRQVLEHARNDAHSSISRYNPSRSTALCYANHNKPGKLRGLTRPRKDTCAIAHASFFFFFSSAVLILPRYLNCISINLNVGMFLQNLGSKVWVLSKAHSHLHCQNPANSQVRGFYWYGEYDMHQMCRVNHFNSLHQV